MSDARLNERIVTFIRTETERLHQELEEKDQDGDTYSMAFEVNEIAAKLGVVPEAINGALGFLHGKKRVIGYRVIKTGGGSTYAIALHPPRVSRSGT